MRKTLTLDADVVHLIEEEVHRRRATFKEVVNDSIRRGLSPQAPSKLKPYHFNPHHTELQPGIDPAGFNRLADELEDDSGEQ